MRMAQGLVVVSLAGLLGGCATVTSEPVRSTVVGSQRVPDEIKPGLTYYLPRQMVKLTVEKSNLETGKLLKAQNEAAAKAAAATTARQKIEADIAALKEKIVKVADTAAVRDMLMADLKKLETSLEAAMTAEKTAIADAGKATDALLAFRPAAPDGTGTHTVLKMELLPMAPDPAFAFRLDPKHSMFRDDKHKIALTTNGLLTSTDIVADDRTDDILAEIAVLAGYTAGGGLKAMSQPSAIQKSAIELKCGGASDKVIAIVDLANPQDVARFNNDVRCLGIKVDLASNAASYTTGLPSEGAPRLPGLFYRPVIDVSVRVSYCKIGVCLGDTDWFLKDTLNVPLPQLGAISPVPQRSGFMTRTAYKNTFRDGILVEYDADRPSEVLELARTPVRLVDGVFDGISKVISLRTGANTDRVNLSASELATFQSLASDTEKLRLYQKCAAEKRAADEPLTPCLDLLD